MVRCVEGSTASLVKSYVSNDPMLVECIKMGIVNYSALARRLAVELEELTGKKHSIVAIKMALVRMAESISGDSVESVEKVVAASTLAVQDYISVITVPRESIVRALRIVAKYGEASRFIQFVQSLRTATIIVASEDKPRIVEDLGRSIEIIDGQSAVILVSPKGIVTTPGVIAYITGFLAKNGINITQVISCYVDTILVLDSSDASRAYTLLHQLIQRLRQKHSIQREARSEPVEGPHSPHKG